jgi:ribosomal peptide maturation radical SAM protein 1
VLGELASDADRSKFAVAAAAIADASEEWLKQFLDPIEWSEVSVVGFSATFNILPVIAVAQKLKLANPSIKVIVGGAQCEGELGAGLIKAFDCVDFVCRGEGERTLPKLMHALNSGRRTFQDFPGLCWRSITGEARANAGRSPEIILDESPIPKFDTFFETHARLFGPEGRTRCAVPVETSRGCWFGEKSHCTFCGLNGEAMHYRHRAADKALEVIRSAATYGTPTAFAVDNIFPNEYFKTLLPLLAEEPQGIELFYEVKSNLTIEHCRLLVAAGVRALQPGIESLSSPVLHLMRKGTTAFLNVRLIKYAAQSGLNLAWNMLYGFPGEDPSEYDRQASLVPLLSHLQPPVSDCAQVRVYKC